MANHHARSEMDLQEGERDNPIQNNVNQSLMARISGRYTQFTKDHPYVTSTTAFSAFILIFACICQPLSLYVPSTAITPTIDTTELVQSFNDSFVTIAKLGNIDFTPLRTFSSVQWEASKMVTRSKLEIEFALADTDLPREHKQELYTYLNNIEDLFTEMSQLSDLSGQYYSRQNAAFGTFLSNSRRMQKMLTDYRFDDIVKVIQVFIDYALETKDQIHKLRLTWNNYKEQTKAYHKQLVHHQYDMKTQHKQAKQMAMEQLQNDYPIFSGFMKYFRGEDEMAQRFTEAEKQFDIIAKSLDESVKGIMSIIYGLDDIQANLEEAKRRMEQNGINAIEMNKLMENKITSSGYGDELCASLELVISNFEIGARKYEGTAATPNVMIAAN